MQGLRNILSKYSLLLNSNSINYQWIIFFILTFSHMIMAMFFYVWGPLGPTIKNELDINNSNFGIIVSSMYLAMGAISIPSGFLIDLYGSKAILILSMLLTLFAFTLISLPSTYFILLLGSLFGGIGYGMINQVTAKGLMYWFEHKKRATVMGIKQTGVPIGGSLVALYIPFFSNIVGWKCSIFFLALVSFVIMVFSFIFYKEKPSIVLSPGERLYKPKKKPAIRTIVFKPFFIIIILMSTLMAICQASLTSFLVIYLLEKFSFSHVLAGSFLTVALIGGIIARIAFGIISDRIFHGDRLSPLALLSLIGICSSLSLIFVQNEDIILLYIISILLGSALIGWNALVITLVAEISGHEIVGSVMGIVLTLIWGGMMIGPIVFGLIVDMSNYTYAWLMISFLTFITSIGFISLRKYNLTYRIS